jgi:hypothetical protein
MADPLVPPVESRDIQRTVILTVDGIPITTGATDERAMVNPDGGHTFIKTDIRVATKDGHIIDAAHGDVALHCPRCHSGPWSKHVMSVCTSCRCLVCATCTVPTPTGTYCTDCHRTITRQYLWRWLLCIL